MVEFAGFRWTLTGQFTGRVIVFRRGLPLTEQNRKH
jgi:hypothetical protein